MSKATSQVSSGSDSERIREMNAELIKSAIREQERTEQAELDDLAAMQQLQEVSTQLIGEDDPDALYEKVLDAALAIMRSQYATIQMFHPKRGDGGELKLLISRGFDPAAANFWQWVRPVSQTTCGMALRTGKRVVVEDVEACEWMAGSEDLKTCVDTGIRAIQTTPLVSRSGRLVGMLSTHWSHSHEPTERDFRLLDVLARQATDLIERMQADERLRQSEERFQRFMHHLPGLAWIKNEKGQYIYANDSALEAFNSAPDELYGHTDSDIFPPETALQFEANDQEALATESGVQVVETLEQEDGVHYSLVTKFPIVGTDGESSLIGGTAFDITEQKRFEEALRESEEKFRILSETAPALIWFDDPEGNCRYVNRQYLDFSGKSLTDIEGAGWHLVLHPEDSDAYIAAFREAQKERRSFRHRVRALRHDGEWRWIESYAQPLFGANGAYLGHVGISPDVTEHHEAEENQNFLFAITEKIRVSRNDEGLMADISELLGKHLGVHRCLFNEIDLENDTETVHRDFSRTGESVAGKHKISDYSPAASESMISGQTVVNHDSRTDPRTAGLYEKVYGPNKELSYITVPMLRGGKWVASLWCSDDKPRTWSSTEVALVENIAERAWSAVERLRAENRLRESEERFSKAFKASPLILTISSLETGKLIEVNDTFVDISGYSREEAIGRTTLELGVWANPPDREAEMELLRTAGELNSREYVFRTRDGRELVGLLSAERVEIGGEACALTVIQDITDRKQAAEKLRESEERFRLATEAVRAVIYDWNILEDTIERTNEVERLLGFGPSDPITQTNSWWRTRLHPEDLGRALASVENAIASGAARFEVEYRIRHRDGHYIWVRDVGQLIYDGRGRAVRCVGSVTDITERKRANEALRESEQRFRYTSDAAPVLIWMSDITRQCTWVNKRWLDFTGRAIEDEMGEGWTEGIHPEDVGRCLEIYTSTFDRREEFAVEYRLRRADGEYRWLLENGVPRFSPGGEFLGYIGSCVDIHDRRAAEAALRESRERLQLAQHAGNVGVWDWDISAGITYWSDTMWKFYGADPRSGNPDDAFWTSHLHDQDRVAVKQRLERALTSDADHYKDEFRVKAGGDRIRWIESIANISRDSQGRAVRMYGVNIDITERKISEERIRRSENQLRLVTNSAPALIAYIDHEQRYRFVNERYAEWFGIPTDEILGMKMRDVLGNHAFKVIKPMLLETLEGKPTSFQTRLHYKSAGSRYVQISYIPDIAEDGTVRGLYSLVSDLTDWKRSEDLLRSSEQRVAMLMESVTDYAIFSINIDGFIETWNVGAENIFGYSTDEIAGRSVNILFPAEDVAKGAQEVEMRNARREGKAVDERWLVRKDGSRFFASGVMMPLRIGRSLDGYVKIVSDLTEKKRRAETLQLAHDELELRVHDRTRDLADVNEALRKEIEERERSEAVKIGLLHRIVSAQETERQRIARDIHDQLGQRLTALRLKLAALRDDCGENGVRSKVERLQDIARLLDSEVSFLASELRPNTLDDLGLEEALRAHAGDWSRHYDIGLDFHSNGMTGKRLGRNTEIQLYRIAQEALNNVAKHADATQVNLLLEKTADSLVLIVEDNGKGFEPTETNIRIPGRGLGLVGMNERASLIGAAIEIESVPKKGTTVFVRLPLGRQKEKQ